MTTDSEALKPCPFCGNRPEWEILDPTEDAEHIWCPSCGIETIPRRECDRATAIERWNRRPAEDRRVDEPCTMENIGLAWQLLQANKAAKELTAERDALKAQLERMTSDEAVEAAGKEIDPSAWRGMLLCGRRERARDIARSALAAALRVAKGD